ncbi:MAG: hypothetical protein ACM3PY_15880 [Omnitrophica WOR_2 bacterium]
MNTLAPIENKIKSWTLWFRFRKGLLWALRGLNAGLAIAFLSGLFLVPRGLLLQPEYIRFAAAASGLGMILAAAIAYGIPFPLKKAAQYFDLKFKLQERMSTALELASTQPPTIPAIIIQQQFEDAVAFSNGINPRKFLPIKTERIQWIAAGFLVFAIAILSIKGEPYFKAAAGQRAVQQAIHQEITQIQALKDEIHKDPNLTEEQRRALTQPLDEALQGLNRATSKESAISVLTSAGQELSLQQDPGSSQEAQALQDAGKQLIQSDNQTLQQMGKNLAGGQFPSAAQDLKNLDLSRLTTEQASSLAQQLNTLAENLQATNPEISRQLEKAAQAIQKGDQKAAQQALEQAAQALAQDSQNITRSQLAGQAASQVNQGQQRVLQAGQGSQTASTGSNNSESSGQNGQNGQSGQNQGLGSTNNQPNQAGVGGAGRGEGNGASEPGQVSGSSPIEQGNGPGNGGERSYEPIYAPQHLGGSGGDPVTLPGSAKPGEQVTGQGSQAPGAQGTSQVPYTQVFPAYEQAYQQAMDSGQIPVFLRSLVRQYFSSLQP